MPAVRSIAAAEPLAVGARFREKSGLVTMRSQLVQVDPPRALARTWKVSGLRTKAIEHWSLEQRDGITVARTEQSWRRPGRPAILSRGFPATTGVVGDSRPIRARDKCVMQRSRRSFVPR
jgi:hypothetical protein